MTFERGEQVSFALDRVPFGDWTWRVRSAAGTQRHSTLLSAPMTAATLKKAALDYQPSLNAAGGALADVLSWCDGSRSVDTIARSHPRTIFRALSHLRRGARFRAGHHQAVHLRLPKRGFPRVDRGAGAVGFLTEIRQSDKVVFRPVFRALVANLGARARCRKRGRTPFSEGPFAKRGTAPFSKLGSTRMHA